MVAPKEHNWDHDGQYCHENNESESGDAARSVCEGMYLERGRENDRLCNALRQVYALAGENPEVRKIINDALDENEI